MNTRKSSPTLAWALLWRGKNKADGLVEHLIYINGVPHLFNHRKFAEAWRKEKYGYIKTRDDLRAEPHGWLMPRAIRVEVREWREK